MLLFARVRAYVVVDLEYRIQTISISIAINITTITTKQTQTTLSLPILYESDDINTTQARHQNSTVIVWLL